MRIPRTGPVLPAAVFALLVALPAHAVSNRIFMSTNGNNASDCANPLTPCLTFAGALAQVNPGGEVIAEATGGYGPLSITSAVTISGPPGVVIYSGLQVTVNAPGATTVVLRGLTIDGSGVGGSGIEVVAVGTLLVEDCVIRGFTGAFGFGVHMGAPGNLNVKNTVVEGCFIGIEISNISGLATASIDHCHLDANTVGFRSHTTAAGSSATTATFTTANNNLDFGWVAGATQNGLNTLNLEFCSGSGNATDGFLSNGSNGSSISWFSSCVFSNNGSLGISVSNSAVVASRGNNTATGNPSGPSVGPIVSFTPM